MPTVYDFLDHRDFTRAWLAEHPRLSQRWLAEKLGVAPSFVSMVLRRERFLALNDARRWGEALGLEGEELAYFDAMIRADSGPTLPIRRAARHMMQAQRDFHLAARAPGDARWVASWVHLALLELARTTVFRSDPTWLAAHLWPPVDADRVGKALRELQESGALKETEEGWRTDLRPIRTALQVTDPALAVPIRSLRLDQLDHAGRAIDDFDPEHSYTASFTLAIRRDRLPQLVQRVQAAHVELIEPFRDETTDMLVEVLLAVFPRTVE